MERLQPVHRYALLLVAPTGSRHLLIPAAALVPDTPFGLEVRSFTFVGRTLHFHQHPWVEGAKSIGAVLWDAVCTFSHFIYLFIL